MNTSTNSTLTDLPRQTDTYPEHKASVWIWKIVPPILLILGTVGNFLSILILTRRSIRASTTTVYLVGLAISDILALYSGLFTGWMVFLFNIYIVNTSRFVCKVNTWLLYTSFDLSGWILMAVTLQRVISAWRPHRVKTVCTKKSAVISLLSIAIFLLAFNSHVLYGWDLILGESQVFGDGWHCAAIPGQYWVFVRYTWPWMDFCMFCVIPFSVIVVGNMLIFVKVIESQQRSRGRVTSPENGALNPRHGQSQHGGHSSMTATLFTLNIVFLVSTLPVSVYLIGEAYWSSGVTNKDIASMTLFWTIASMLQYTNNSVNFIIYCLSGSKFRQELTRLYRKSDLFRRDQPLPLTNMPDKDHLYQ